MISAKSAPTKRGRVHHVSAKDAHDDPDVVLGTLLVNSVPASVLFDTGASHSFMSEDFTFMHGIKSEDMNASLLVHTPAGQFRTSMICNNVPVEIEGLEFLVSPIILKSCSIDLILGIELVRSAYCFYSLRH